MIARIRTRQRFAAALTGVALVLAGCSSLPESGPTAHDIVKRTQTPNTDFNFQIVTLDTAMVSALNATAAREQAGAATLASLARDGRSDLIGPGDVLAVSIYEVGVSLFAGGGVRGSSGTGFDPSAHSETFPAIVVDTKGEIDLPYLGRLSVAGLTAQDVQMMIRSGLKEKSQAPQALVTVRENISNTVYVSGDVKKPERLELTLDGERLLDAITLAGGASSTAEDTLVRFARDGRVVEQRLSSIRSAAPDDLVLRPGDRIELIKQPRTYIAFGASNRVSRIDFGPGGDSLAEAIAQVGGPNDAAADATAIFLFRDGATLPAGYVPPVPPAVKESWIRKAPPTPVATSYADPAKPVLFRLNMMDPNAYILAQRFSVRDKDVIYIANARTNQLSKLAGIVNGLFTPFITARALAPSGGF